MVSPVCWAPARTLPDLLAEAAEREAQSGQITAAPASLPGGLMADCRAWHVPVRAVPQALELDEFASRFGDDPSGTREVTEHRVLIGQVLRGGPGVTAPQDKAPVRHLQQPASVLERGMS